MIFGRHQFAGCIFQSPFTGRPFALGALVFSAIECTQGTTLRRLSHEVFRQPSEERPEKTALWHARHLTPEIDNFYPE
jgi:hypothetical protein